MAALSDEAKNWIRWTDGTIAGYVRHYFPDGKWGGDSCGCVDDRCIGHHHAAGTPCHCVEGWVDDYLAALTVGRGVG